MGDGGGSQDYVSRKINWTLSQFTEKGIVISPFTKKKKWHFSITPRDSALLDVYFIIRPLVLRVAKRNPSNNTKRDNVL